PRRPPPRSTLFRYTTLFRSLRLDLDGASGVVGETGEGQNREGDISLTGFLTIGVGGPVLLVQFECLDQGLVELVGIPSDEVVEQDRKSTRLNSSHVKI